jgi:hypothetical protein
MNTKLHSRNRSFASGLAAAAVTTALVSTLVGSFDPAQLLRINDETAGAQIATVDARRDTAFVREA